MPLLTAAGPPAHSSATNDHTIQAWAQESLNRGAPFSAVHTVCRRLGGGGTHLHLSGLGLSSLPDVSLAPDVVSVDLSQNPLLSAIPPRFLGQLTSAVVNLVSTAISPESGLQEAHPSLRFLWHGRQSSADGASEPRESDFKLYLDFMASSPGQALPVLPAAEDLLSCPGEEAASLSAGEGSLDEAMCFIEAERVRERTFMASSPRQPWPARSVGDDVLPCPVEDAPRRSVGGLTLDEVMSYIEDERRREPSACSLEPVASTSGAVARQNEPDVQVSSMPVSATVGAALAGLGASDNLVSIEQLQRWLSARPNLVFLHASHSELTRALITDPPPGSITSATLYAVLSSHGWRTNPKQCWRVTSMVNATVSAALQRWVEEHSMDLVSAAMLRRCLTEVMPFDLLIDLTVESLGKALHWVGQSCGRATLSQILEAMIPRAATDAWVLANNMGLRAALPYEPQARVRAALLADCPQALSPLHLHRFLWHQLGMRVTINEVADLVQQARQAQRLRAAQGPYV